MFRLWRDLVLESDEIYPPKKEEENVERFFKNLIKLAHYAKLQPSGSGCPRS